MLIFLQIFPGTIKPTNISEVEEGGLYIGAIDVANITKLGEERGISPI